jgi:hypothetical protein
MCKEFRSLVSDTPAHALSGFIPRRPRRVAQRGMSGYKHERNRASRYRAITFRGSPASIALVSKASRAPATCSRVSGDGARFSTFRSASRAAVRACRRSRA